MGDIRITGGSLARRRLKVPPRGVRPTSDRVREALFSSLGDTVSGARVLDAFGGTVALALEALSRGAASALVVERDTRTRQMLQANVDGLGLQADVSVQAGDAAQAIAKIPAGTIDLAFVDPPYADEIPAELLESLARALSPEGTIVIERDRRSPPLLCAILAVLRERTYGDTRLTFLVAPSCEDNTGGSR